MKFKGIPVSSIGPDSQPGEEDGEALSYIDMPKNMSKYHPPQMPEPETVTNLDGAREAMDWLRSALTRYGRSSEPQLAELTALDPDNRELINQILGEGEVSVTCSGSAPARSQEAVLAGVWRTLYLDKNDCVTVDLLEVADAPHLVRDPNERDLGIDISEDDVPIDVMNAMPILIELESHVAEYERNRSTHAINLTLLPLSDADVEFLDKRLGRGPVDILSRAYGKCQIISTLTPNVWWVRYYNSMSSLILNTLEVTDAPKVVCAAPEDLSDSAKRLDQILAPYWSDVA